jgi:DNA-binding PadR family transcriptional regulator
VSVRLSLLAILDQGPCYGYQLRTEFERRTGSTWPVNVGQIYNTLDRLVRDRLATKTEPMDAGQTYFEITQAGSSEVARWFGSAVLPRDAAANELAIKVAMAVTLPGVDAVAVLRIQQAEVERMLAEITLATEPRDALALAIALIGDSIAGDLRAELDWLARSEREIRRASPAPEPVSRELPKRGRPVGAAATSPDRSSRPPQP